MLQRNAAEILSSSQDIRMFAQKTHLLSDASGTGHLPGKEYT